MKKTSAQKTLGNNLLRLRSTARLTQQAVAKGAGISSRCYAGMEYAEKPAHLATIEKLAKFFKTTPSELLKDA